MSKPDLLSEVRHACRLNQMSPRTEKTYINWIIRFFRFLKRQHPGVRVGGLGVRG